MNILKTLFGFCCIPTTLITPATLTTSTISDEVIIDIPQSDPPVHPQIFPTTQPQIKKFNVINEWV